MRNMWIHETWLESYLNLPCCSATSLITYMSFDMELLKAMWSSLQPHPIIPMGAAQRQSMHVSNKAMLLLLCFHFLYEYRWQGIYNVSILHIKTRKYTRLVYLKSTIIPYRCIQKTILYSKVLNSKQHVVLQTLLDRFFSLDDDDDDLDDEDSRGEEGLLFMMDSIFSCWLLP